MTIRAIIFDLGHTLWDIGPQGDALERAYAAAHVTLSERLRRDDLPPPKALRRAVNDVLHAQSETYFMQSARVDQPPTHAWVDEAFRSLGLTLDEPLLREITPPLFATEIHNLVCHDGTVAAAEALAADGYTLGCITNTLADTAAIRSMLRLHGFEPLMKCVIVSADEGWRKPHRGLFEKALRETGAAPHEAVYVGDSPFHDIAGAQAAGMRAILTRQYVTRDTAGYPEADAVIDHLRELRAAIDAIEAIDARS